MSAIDDRQVELPRIARIARIARIVAEAPGARIVVVAVAEDGSMPVGENRPDVGRRCRQFRMCPRSGVRVGIVQPAIGLQAVCEIESGIGEQRQMPDAGIAPFADAVATERLAGIRLSGCALGRERNVIGSDPEVSGTNVRPAAVGLSPVRIVGAEIQEATIAQARANPPAEAARQPVALLVAAERGGDRPSARILPQAQIEHAGDCIGPVLSGCAVEQHLDPGEGGHRDCVHIGVAGAAIRKGAASRH